MAFRYEVDPETFAIKLLTADGSLMAALPGQERAVEEYREKDEGVSWRYQEEQIAVSVTPVDDYLSITITSETDSDNAFTWPEISAASYYFPFGEGKRVPADDPVWKDYLAGQTHRFTQILTAGRNRPTQQRRTARPMRQTRLMRQTHTILPLRNSRSSSSSPCPFGYHQPETMRSCS